MLYMTQNPQRNYTDKGKKRYICRIITDYNHEN